MSEPILWIVVIMAVAAAAVIGYYVGRGNVDRQRVDTLEAQIKSQSEEMTRRQMEHETYRREVSAHFDKTATLFVDMAGSYKALFEHLSEGYEMLSDKSTSKVLPDRPGALLDGPDVGSGNASDARRDPTLDVTDQTAAKAAPKSESAVSQTPEAPVAAGVDAKRAEDNAGTQKSRDKGKDKDQQADRETALPPLKAAAELAREAEGVTDPDAKDKDAKDKDAKDKDAKDKDAKDKDAKDKDAKDKDGKDKDGKDKDAKDKDGKKEDGEKEDGEKEDGKKEDGEKKGDQAVARPEPGQAASGDEKAASAR